MEYLKRVWRVVKANKKKLSAIIVIPFLLWIFRHFIFEMMEHLLVDHFPYNLVAIVLIGAWLLWKKIWGIYEEEAVYTTTPPATDHTWRQWFYGDSTIMIGQMRVKRKEIILYLKIGLTLLVVLTTFLWWITSIILKWWPWIIGVAIAIATIVFTTRLLKKKSEEKKIGVAKETDSPPKKEARKTPWGRIAAFTLALLVSVIFFTKSDNAIKTLSSLFDKHEEREVRVSLVTTKEIIAPIKKHNKWSEEVVITPGYRVTWGKSDSAFVVKNERGKTARYDREAGLLEDIAVSQRITFQSLRDEPAKVKLEIQPIQ